MDNDRELGAIMQPLIGSPVGILCAVNHHHRGSTGWRPRRLVAHDAQPLLV